MVLIAVCAAAAVNAQTIRVVNMIPRSLSHESQENSQPTASVHPTNQAIAAATAYTLGASNFCDREHSLSFVSSDSGETWAAVCLLPTPPDGDGLRAAPPMDMSTRFSGDGASLYASFITVQGPGPGPQWFDTEAHVVGITPPRGASLPDLMSRAMRGQTTPTFLTMLVRQSVDQPYLTAAPHASAAFTVGADDDYMFNDSTCFSGAVFYAQNPSPLSQLARSYCVAFRPSQGTTPAVRAAIASDGSIYALFYRPTGLDTVDVIVVRNDPLALLSPTFGALRDNGPLSSPSGPGKPNGPACVFHDGLPGFRVKPCALYNVARDSLQNFGNERRVRTELSIAVSPANAAAVYIAWGDSVPNTSAHMTLHFAKSEDRLSTIRVSSSRSSTIA